MTCLIIDTSKPETWVALVREGVVVQEEVWKSDRTLGVTLLSVLEKLVGSEGKEALDRIAVHGGPGHYSALRTGIVTGSMVAQEWGVELVQLTKEERGELLQEAQTAQPISVIVPVYRQSEGL